MLPPILPAMFTWEAGDPPPLRVPLERGLGGRRRPAPRDAAWPTPPQRVLGAAKYLVTEDRERERVSLYLAHGVSVSCRGCPGATGEPSQVVKSGAEVLPW